MTEENQAALDDSATIDEGATEAPVIPAEDTALESPEATAASDGEVSTEIDEKQLALNKLAFEKREEKRKRKALEEENARLKAEAPKAETAKPKLEDFDYDSDAFNAAVIKYEVQQGLQVIQQSTKADQKAREQETIQHKFNARVAEFSKKAPDYAEHIPNLPEFQPETLNAILQMDDGPEVALYLAKHADIADKIADATPAAAGITLGKISLQLSNAKPKPKPSAAPDPIDPLIQAGVTAGEKVDPLLKGATFE